MKGGQERERGREGEGGRSLIGWLVSGSWCVCACLAVYLLVTVGRSVLELVHINLS